MAAGLRGQAIVGGEVDGHTSAVERFSDDGGQVVPWTAELALRVLGVRGKPREEQIAVILAKEKPMIREAYAALRAAGYVVPDDVHCSRDQRVSGGRNEARGAAMDEFKALAPVKVTEELERELRAIPKDASVEARIRLKQEAFMRAREKQYGDPLATTETVGRRGAARPSPRD